MYKKTALSLLLAAAVLLTGCGSAAESSAADTTEPPAPRGHSLVTLGDSISFGYGLDDIEAERYSALLTEKLSEYDGTVWNDYNYAVTGDDSSDLLRRLQNGKALRLPSADTIVIGIGANNLLGAYVDYLSSLMRDTGFSENDLTELEDSDIEQMQQDIMNKLETDTQAYEQLQKDIDTGLQTLETDLESIYTWIREHNADADIYMMNVYNPYADVTETALPQSDEPLSATAQRQIDRCNAILTQFAAAHTDIVLIDVATDFAACHPVPIIGGGDAADGLYLDPHPNAEGQQRIADLLFTAMRKQQ